MNPFPNPRFVFDPNDPRTSPGFVLILTLAKHRRALDQLRFQSLDFFTGGRPASCLAVLILGLGDQPTPDQLQRLHQLSRRWGVAVKAVASAEAAAGFGSWLLGELHRLFHHCCGEVLPVALQLACLRQMCQDAMEAFIRQPLETLTSIPASSGQTTRFATYGRHSSPSSNARPRGCLKRGVLLAAGKDEDPS